MPRYAPLIPLLSLLGACAQAPPPATDGFATLADGARLYYQRLGTGEQVVVIPMAVYLSDALAPLAEGRQLILYDPVGRGRSGPTDTARVSLDREVADLEELREALGIERMALLGWSGLGMQMAVYAMRHPDRVTRLVQVSPVPPAESIMLSAGGDTRAARVDTAAVTSLLGRHGRGDFADDPAGFCRQYNALSQPGSFADPSHLAKVPDLCEHPNEWPLNLWPYFGALLGSFRGYDWRDSIRALEIPRLVIHGREDGIPLAGAQAWVEGYPNSRLIVLSPAGHFPFLERPAEFFPAVDRFLNGEWPPEARGLP